MFQHQTKVYAPQQASCKGFAVLRHHLKLMLHRSRHPQQLATITDSVSIIQEEMNNQPKTTT
jgi:hypothetical protein